jgi:hypothetical protein
MFTQFKEAQQYYGIYNWNILTNVLLSTTVHLLPDNINVTILTGQEFRRFTVE